MVKLKQGWSTGSEHVDNIYIQIVYLQVRGVKPNISLMHKTSMPQSTYIAQKTSIHTHTLTLKLIQKHRLFNFLFSGPTIAKKLGIVLNYYCYVLMTKKNNKDMCIFSYHFCIKGIRQKIKMIKGS